MTPEAFHAAALALPGATFDVKWGADRVYSVGDKMFAVAGRVGEAAPSYAMKASDASFEQLVEEGSAIPAPYLARAKWVQFTGDPALPDDQFLAYLRQAHALVAAKLTRKLQRSLGV